jgi:hypothetical protein
MKTQETEIKVNGWYDSDEIGECAGCARYRDPSGEVRNHRVYEMVIKDLVFPLCPNCKDDLLAKLKKLEP